MRNVNRQHTAPLKGPRTNRNHAVAVLTSGKPGKCIPIAAIPMLREDALRGRIRVNLEMLETKEILMNPVTARVTAYCVPFLAFERFEGSRDQFDRSYMGQPKVEGGDVVPFLEAGVRGVAIGPDSFEAALGLHNPVGRKECIAYKEAYNAIWNFRARNRSKELTLRARNNASLAPAFWQHSRFAHVLPDFDQAVIDGEVALNIVDQNIPLNGIGVRQLTAGAASNFDVRTTVGTATENWAKAWSTDQEPGAGHGGVIIREDPDRPGFPAVFAEMAASNITLSLANLELARKTQAFAKLRERYEGHDDEYIIDMLMDGLSIPDQALKQPFLIADRTVRFGQAKRYATDSGNLDDSAVSGAAMVDIALRVPRLNTGGVVIVQVEILPEQLFERQSDPLFNSENHDKWPEFLRDTLDPEKVDVIKNGDIDMSHATPDGTFGYAPMNWAWNAFGPRLGGKFYKPSPTTPNDDVRQRVWAVERANPTLAADFYIAQYGIHTKPFLDEVSDPFEMTAMGNCVLNGNTVFGGMLVEDTGNYDKVMEKAPMDRIEKE